MVEKLLFIRIGSAQHKMLSKFADVRCFMNPLQTSNNTVCPTCSKPADNFPQLSRARDCLLSPILLISERLMAIVKMITKLKTLSLYSWLRRDGLKFPNLLRDSARGLVVKSRHDRSSIAKDGPTIIESLTAIQIIYFDEKT